MQKLIESFFVRMKVSPKISMELENIEAIKSLVVAGLGASIVPLCSVRSLPQGSMLRVMRVRGYALQRELALATLDAEMLPTALEKLAAQLIKALRRTDHKRQMDAL
jgi:DNA-binding transcriptional LysR family regulator